MLRLNGKAVFLQNKRLTKVFVSLFLFLKIAMQIADRALLDKKNTEDDKITMSVAKGKGEWTILSVSFKKYKEMLF